MEPVTTRYFVPDLPDQKKSNHTLCWNIFSIIIFPIGIARVLHYLVHTYILPLGIVLALPRTLFTKHCYSSCSREFPKRFIDRADSTHSMKQFTYKTRDKVKIDSLMITQKEERNPNDQKWIVIPLPNIVFYQDIERELVSLAKTIDVNILCMNYRGVGPRGGRWPSSFKDIVEDVDAGVRELFKKGVLPENILCEGLSLGGAAALHVAAKYQQPGHEMHALIQNTFSSLGTESRLCWKTLLENLQQESEPLHPKLVPIQNTLFALTELTIYVAYYTFSFFENLVTCKWKESLIDLYTVTKAIVLEPIILVISSIALLLQLLELPLKKSIVSHKLIQAITYLNLCIASPKNSLALKLAESKRIGRFIEWFVNHTNWRTDGATVFQKLKGKAIVTYSPHDIIIPWPASLAKALQDRKIPAKIVNLETNRDKQSNHGSTMWITQHTEYYRFVVDAGISTRAAYYLPEQA